MANCPDDRFLLPGQIPDATDPRWREEGEGIPGFEAAQGEAGDPHAHAAAFHARTGEAGHRPAHRAGRGWVPVSREIGLPRDEYRAAEREAMEAFAALSPLPLAGGAGGGHESAATSPYTPATSHLAFTPLRQMRFCEHLSASGNVRSACAVAGISPQTAYKARRRSPGFARAWDAALVLARAHAEAVLADRALNGVEEPVFYHGEEVAVRRRYDSRLLLAHLARLDARCDSRRASADAAQFDALLAALAGDEPAPAPAPSRAEHIAEARRHAELQALFADEDDEAEDEWQEGDPAEAAARAAAEEWDKRQSALEAGIDALLAGEGEEEEEQSRSDARPSAGWGLPPQAPRDQPQVRPSAGTHAAADPITAASPSEGWGLHPEAAADAAETPLAHPQRGPRPGAAASAKAARPAGRQAPRKQPGPASGNVRADPVTPVTPAAIGSFN